MWIKGRNLNRNVLLKLKIQKISISHVIQEHKYNLHYNKKSFNQKTELKNLSSTFVPNKMQIKSRKIHS
jgi:hypothetical protein